MFFEEIVSGRYVELRSVTEDDAEFTRNIRRDPEFAEYFPRLDNTVEQQRDWIRFQQNKEGDYFFVVWDKDNNRIGTIAVYDVKGKCCESGRLAVRGNAFQSFEAQMLAFKFAFEYLEMDTVIGFIFSENKRAIRFNKQLGGVMGPPEMHDNGHYMVKATYTREVVEKALNKIEKIMYR